MNHRILEIPPADTGTAHRLDCAQPELPLRRKPIPHQPVPKSGSHGGFPNLPVGSEFEE